MCLQFWTGFIFRKQLLFVVWSLSAEPRVTRGCHTGVSCGGGPEGAAFGHLDPLGPFVPVPTLERAPALPSPLPSTHLLVLDQLKVFFSSMKSMEGVYRGLSEVNTSLQILLPMLESASKSGSPGGIPDGKQLLIFTAKGILIANS